MPCSRAIQIIAASCMALLAWTSPVLAQNPAFRLAYSDVNTYPYQMGDGLEIMQPAGIAIDIIKQAAQDVGITVEFHRLPNKRVLLELQNGVIDGAFIFSHNQERQVFADYPTKNGVPDPARRLAKLSYYLYRNKAGSVDWDGQKFWHLHGPVGANAGYSIIGDLKKWGVTVEEAKNNEQNFHKLRLGRLAAVAAQDHVADLYLQRSGARDVEKLPRPLAEKDYYLIFNHNFAAKNRGQVEQLWNRIGAIRDNMTRTLLPHYPVP